MKKKSDERMGNGQNEMRIDELGGRSPQGTKEGSVRKKKMGLDRGRIMGVMVIKGLIRKYGAS